jgi:hypothetical protein
VLATPRWLGWTLLAVLAVIVCAGMAYWQLGRAESPTGSVLNAGYALQWPLFGVFFAALWWRMLHAEAHQLAVLRGEIPDDGIADDRDATGFPADGDAGPEAGPAWTSASRAPVVEARDTPFTPRPAGIRPGDGQGAPPRGRARADYNAMLAALARSDTDETR